MRFYLKYIIILISIVNCKLLIAQERQIRWFKEQQGLPNTYILDIEQDKSGKILLATYMGVVVYDGSSFTLKTLKDGLQSTSTGQFFKDNYNRVWVFSYSKDLSIWDDGVISTFNSFNYYSENKITADIHIISKNEVIVDYVFPFKTITHINKNGKWQKSKEQNFDENRLPLRDPKNKREVCGYLDYNLLEKERKICFKFNNGKIFERKLEQNYSLFRTKSGLNKEYISMNNILFEYNKEGIVKYKIFEDDINEIVLGKNNTLWLIYSGGGAQQISDDTFETTNTTILKEYTISSFLEDIDGGVWFSTKGQLGYIPKISYKTISAENNPINTGIMLNDTIIIGHSNGDVSYVLSGNLSKSEIIYKHGSKKSPVASFHVEDSGNILFSNLDYGIYRINRKTFNVKQLYNLQSNQFHSKKGIIYCGLFEDGVCKISSEKIEVIPALHNNQKLTVECVFVNEKNELLLGTYQGLYKYDSINCIPLFYKKELKDRITRIENFNDINVIHTCGSGVIISKNSDTLILNTNNGLVTNCVGDICVDGENKLWIPGPEGISTVVLNPKNIFDYKITNIHATELLNHLNFCVLSHKSKIYLLSKYMIYEIDKNSKQTFETKIPFKISLTKQNVSISNPKRIKIKYTKKSIIEFYFKQINFRPDTYVEYYYRLVNYNNNWQKTIDEKVNYSALPPGMYYFEIFPKFSYKDSPGKLKRITINIQENFWQKIWVKVIIFALILLAVFLIVLFLFKKKLYSIKNDYQVQQKLSELESMALRSQMNPHFIFNAINSIQNFILKNDSQSAYYYLGKFARLIRNILEFSKNEFLSIEQEIDLILGYLELEKLRANNKFTYNISVDNSVDKYSTMIPAMLIQPFVENAILHGITSLKDREGKINIVFQLHEDIVKCSIIDNGIGRVKANEIKMKKKLFHESMSTLITKDRIKIINSVYNEKAKFEIIDLYNSKNEPIGTEVNIFLPFKKK